MCPMYMAWRGSLDDFGLYWSKTEDGRHWTPQQPAVGGTAGSAAGPTLEVWRGLVYMAWRGNPDDQGLWWATFDGRTWSGQQRIPGVASSHGPALLSYQDRLHLFWKGAGSDTRLWYSAFDGAEWSSQEVLMSGYSDVTAYGPSVTATLTSIPFLAALRYRPEELDIYSDTNVTRWRHRGVIPRSGATTGPAITGRLAFGGGPDRLLMAWGDAGGQMHASLSNDGGVSWSGPTIMPPVTADRPALRGWGSSDAYAAWRGGGDDRTLYWAYTAGGTQWLNPLTGMPGALQLPDRASVAGPALVAYGTMW